MSTPDREEDLDLDLDPNLNLNLNHNPDLSQSHSHPTPATAVRPTLAFRKSSRMAGAFEPGSDIRDDVSATESGSVHETGSERGEGPGAERKNFDDYMMDQEQEREQDQGQSTGQEQEEYSLGQDNSSLLPPQIDMPVSLMGDSQQARTMGRAQDDQEESSSRLEDEPSEMPAVMNTVLEEEEMRKKLTDFESSFLPELSTFSDQIDGSGASLPADVFDQSFQDTQTTGGVPTHNRSRDDSDATQSTTGHVRPHTTSGFKTPVNEEAARTSVDLRAAARNDDDQPRHIPNTSALEQMSSSPTAARTVSRVQSLASAGGYETAAEREESGSPTFRKRSRSADPDATPRKDRDRNTSLSSLDTSGTVRINVEDYDTVPLNVTRRRPQYLSKRSSNARLSYDSMASSTTETSDATVGADFALQSGGAAPESFRLRRKPNLTLSRSTSLGSLASGVSNMSDEEAAVSKRSVAGVAPELTTLEEESPTLNKRKAREGSPAMMVTPKASTVRLSLPTDSVIANHVRDLEVPDTIARQYRNDRSRSPEKHLSMATMTPGPKRGLTLKEHRSTVEKLGKENFDLKMKIHFLDQALQKRSEDGIKEMITENVQLKSDRLRLEKDNHALRKQIRELQRKLDEATGKNEGDDQGYGTDEERSPTVEEEVLYLRERVEITEIEMEKLRQENINKESEKRRLADMVRNLGDSRAGGSEVGSREERDMWKDMLEAETIAREQAEDDARKLREELAKALQEASRPASKLRVNKAGEIFSRSSSVDTSKTKADNTELDRLRHECSELQKTIGAQASALTSRNKEKEMLYQEIENLKLGRMGGLRSIAGDSILERSASRARSNSRASNGTRYTRVSDNEREAMETRIDELRDQVSQLNLDKQHLQVRCDEIYAELEAADALGQADVDAYNEELAALTQERDLAMRDAEEQDRAFQQLKAEAQQEIDGLGDELDGKIEECNQLEQELKAQADNVNALQAEMRSAAEGLARLEEDSQSNLARYQQVKLELEDSNRELENLEKRLHEAQSKNNMLTVQRESSQNEIAFLREEQDADKIKIGDLESLLKKTHLNLDAERDRARESERRLTEERAQRDAIAGQEKQEIQRTINELNREASNSKNELRQTRKALSAREVELNTFKDRLTQLEGSLRNALNMPDATSSHIVGAVSKAMTDLDHANNELDTTRTRLDEHKKLLAERDELLENEALESRRLEEMVEREQLNRRQDKYSFEQALKSHEQASRMMGQNNARIAELEQARHNHRKQLSNLEVQYKDQLAERNQVLLTVWRKLSAMCGPDWAHNHSLINGNLPSQEVIGNILFWPGFSRNLLLAAKQMEGVLSSFKDKIKTIERDLYRSYNTLEKEFETRNKKLERIEEHWEKMKLREREIEAGLAPSQGLGVKRNPDLQKLKNENKSLKAELRLYQEGVAHAHGPHPSHLRSHERNSRAESRSSNLSGSQYDGYAQSIDAASLNGAAGIPNRGSSIRSPRRGAGYSSVTLGRTNSSSAVETLGGAFDGTSTRSNSITSGRGNDNRNFGFTIGNPGTALAASSAANAGAKNTSTSAQSKEDFRRSLLVPAAPNSYPANGNFSMPSNSAANNTSDTGTGPGTLTRSTSNGKPDEKKWIHRLRELERRLKKEREERLVDRDGARRRLEERDEVNENLKRELERERAGRGWRQDHEEPDKKRQRDSNGGYLVADEPMLNEFVGQIQNAQTREEFIPDAGETPLEAPGYGTYNPYTQSNVAATAPATHGRGYDEDQDAGLRSSEEERLLAQDFAVKTVGSASADSPTVGSSHAQRAAMAQLGRTHPKVDGGVLMSRPDGLRTTSRGSIMASMSPAHRPGSIKEKIIGSSRQEAVRTNSAATTNTLASYASASAGANASASNINAAYHSENNSDSSGKRERETWGKSGAEKEPWQLEMERIARNASIDGMGGRGRVSRSASGVGGMGGS